MLACVASVLYNLVVSVKTNMQQKIKKYLGVNDLLLLAALLVAAALIWNTVQAMQRNYHLQQKYSQLQAEVELLELENQNMRYNIAYLKTDAYLELAAREKFDKAAAGESMVHLPNTKAEATPTAAKRQVPTAKEKQTGWQANINDWWQFLQGRKQHQT